MKINFRSDLMTKEIAYCCLKECPNAKHCLRHVAFQHAAPFHAQWFVDPRRVLEEKCPHYLTCQVERYARGFKRAIGLLPYGSLPLFRKEGAERLGCGRSHFYRYASGVYPLSKAKQRILRDLFHHFGVKEEELFDTYEEGYDLPY